MAGKKWWLGDGKHGIGFTATENQLPSKPCRILLSNGTSFPVRFVIGYIINIILFSNAGQSFASKNIFANIQQPLFDMFPSLNFLIYRSSIFFCWFSHLSIWLLLMFLKYRLHHFGYSDIIVYYIVYYIPWISMNIISPFMKIHLLFQIHLVHPFFPRFFPRSKRCRTEQAVRNGNMGCQGGSMDLALRTENECSWGWQRICIPSGYLT